jgi:hypothetical protein
MAKLVTDPPDSSLGVVTSHLLDTLLKITADSTGPGIRGLTGQRTFTALLVQLAPFAKGRMAHPDQLTDFR